MTACLWSSTFGGNTAVLSSDSLDVVIGSTQSIRGTVGYSDVLRYFEVEYLTNAGAPQVALIGVALAGFDFTAFLGNVDAAGWGYYELNGNILYANGSVGYGATYAVGDIIGVLFNPVSGGLTFYKNGVSQGGYTNAALIGATVYPAVGAGSSDVKKVGFRLAATGASQTYPTPAGAIPWDSTTTALMTGYNIAVIPCLAQAFQRLYLTNDFDAMRVTDDGLVLRTAGIVAPTVAPVVAAAAGGTIGVGTHLVRYRYQDLTRNRLSDPTAGVSITIASGTQIINVTPTASADAYVTGIIIELTPAGAEEYYRAATVANTTTLSAVNMTDDTLIQLVPAARDGDFQHQPAPLSLLCSEHRSRMWLWGATSRDFTGVTYTNGSTSVTGAGFSTEWAGRQLVDGFGSVYVIASATATVITLVVAYAGPNGVSTATVRSGTPSLLCWSRATFPESFDPTAFGRQITLDSGDTPSAIFSYFSDLYLVGQRSMRRLVYTSDPASGMLLALPGSMGAFHQRCVCNDAPGLVFGWGRDGIWMIDSMQPVKISAAVEQTLASLASTTTAVRFVRYEPIHRQALFFFALTGETNCRAALVYHVEQQRWTLRYFRQGMTSACPNSAYLDRQRLMLADENGSSWRVGTATNDGGSAGVVTATGSSATIIPCVNAAVVGQMVYRPATSEARVITISSPASITVSAFSTAVNVGEELWIGSIKQRILSGWFIGDGMDSKKRPHWLQIFIAPNRNDGQMMGLIRVRFYADFNTTSPLAVSSIPSDMWPNGVTVTDAATYIVGDLDVGALDGYIPIPIPDGWTRAIACEVVQEQPYNGVSFVDVVFSADNRLASGPAKNE